MYFYQTSVSLFFVALLYFSLLVNFLMGIIFQIRKELQTSNHRLILFINKFRLVQTFKKAIANI